MPTIDDILVEIEDRKSFTPGEECPICGADVDAEHVRKNKTELCEWCHRNNMDDYS